MAKAPDKLTPLTLLSTFCIPATKPLHIDQLEALETKDQLELLCSENISDNKLRASSISKLYDKVPELKSCAHKRIRLKAALKVFYQLHLSTMQTPPAKWSQKQIPFSFFVFLMERLRREPG